MRQGKSSFVFAASAFALAVLSLSVCCVAEVQPANIIQANSNQAVSGTLASDTLSVALEIREGDWFPESDSGPNLKVFAFSEAGKAPQIPGPLIRVREGTRIHATVHNLLPMAVTLHGLHSRPGSIDDVLQLPPSETREVSFDAGTPGAYYYWARAGGAVWNGRQVKEDSQLTGAFIVDPASGAPPDRVFVIGMWRDQPAPDKSFDIPVINGKSWPYTERLTYTTDDEVRWRWLNPTSLPHPMHMHGSYFRVDSLGDGERDTALASGMQLNVATQFMPVGGTMTTLWVPKTAGHWLFHCHTLAHISPEIMMLEHATSPSSESHAGHEEHKMTGLVLGLNVLPRPGTASTKKPFKARRNLELIVARTPHGGHNTEGYRLVGKGIHAAPPSCPGPPLILTQGEPVAIRVTNQLDEPTAVHWHGIELESFYDGVPGWSGNDAVMAPMIEPGQSFDVHMAPPRAGTFIYHTHMKDLSQLTSGLYGPIIVMPPAKKFDPETDKIFIFTRYGQRRDGGMLINGSSDLHPLQWRAGVSYRLRLIDIGANNNMIITLSRNGVPVPWTPIAKDGADLPPSQMSPLPASFIIAPGETYDFRFQPEEDGDFALSAEIAAFHEKLTQDIHVKSTPGP